MGFAGHTQTKRLNLASLAKHKTHMLTGGREPHLHQDVGDVFVFGMEAEGCVQVLDEPRAFLGVPHGGNVCEEEDFKTIKGFSERTPQYIFK